MQNQVLRIGIVVGEVSGDTLGAELIRQFKAQGIDAEFEGIGGPQMIAEGFNSCYPMDILSVMGIVEVLKDLKKIFAVRDGLIQRWERQPVDVFIGIDAPDFNLRMSQKIKKNHMPIKTVQYVSPSVWAWRQKRVVGIKKNIDLVMCLFPFEKDFYRTHNVPAIFVGHPLAKQLPLDDDLTQARLDLGLNVKGQYIALLPGSRNSEVQRLAPFVFSAAGQLQKQGYTGGFLVPAINEKRHLQIKAILKDFPLALQQKVQILDHTQHHAKVGRQVMAASDIVALASGTATLEAMLLHRPMVTFYKLNSLTYWLVKKMLKIPYVSLPNIIAGKKVIEELVQNDATPTRLATELERLMSPEIAQVQRMQHLSLHKKLISGETEDPVAAILALV